MADFGTTVERYKTARGMSLRALARAANYDPSLLSKVLNGQKTVTPHIAAQLDAALGADGEIIEAAARSVASAHVVQDADRIRQALDDTLAKGMMSAPALADWDTLAERYGCATRDRAAPVLLADLTADLSGLRAAMERHRSASALRRLTLVVARMSGMMCLTLVKLGDRSAFRSWARTARSAATEAGDAPIVAWAAAQEAYGHYYNGDLAEAVVVARHAQEVTRQPCVGAVLAAALEMRARAAMHDTTGTMVALSAAEDILSRLGAADLTASAFGYRESQLRFHQSSAYTNLGDTRAAVRAQEHALELCPVRDYTDWAMIRLDRAACLTLDGDPSAGAQYAAATLQALSTEQRQGVIASRGIEFMRTLPPAVRTAAPARDMRELLMPDDKEAM